MAEPVIHLPRTTRLSRSVIGDCKWKLQTFVDRDAYVEYDYGGGYAQAPSDRISEHQVYVMHRMMKARSSNNSWRLFIDCSLPELQEIPRDLDLVDGEDSQVRAGYDPLSRLALRVMAQPRLTDVSFSKVVHLLRPRFVAISDDYVRRCLGIPDPESASTEERVNTLKAVQRGIRRLAKDNKAALDELADFAADLQPVRPKSGTFASQDVPVMLTKARILDIVLWTDVAIHDMNHEHWTAWYAEEVARPGR